MLSGRTIQLIEHLPRTDIVGVNIERPRKVRDGLSVLVFVFEEKCQRNL